MLDTWKFIPEPKIICAAKKKAFESCIFYICETRCCFYEDESFIEDPERGCCQYKSRSTNASRVESIFIKNSTGYSICLFLKNKKEVKYSCSI